MWKTRALGSGGGAEVKIKKGKVIVRYFFNFLPLVTTTVEVGYATDQRWTDRA